MSILHLTLKKKWFDMIASGEKKEEYRELSDYWCRRFLGLEWFRIHREAMHRAIKANYSIIHFRNGYSSQSPFLTIECKGITVGNGRSEWGGGNLTFIIKLGEIIAIGNYNQ